MLLSAKMSLKQLLSIINRYDIMQSSTQTQSSPYSSFRYIGSILALITAITAILTPAVSGYLLQPFINNLYLQPLSYQLERASQQHSHFLYSKLGQDSALQAKYQQITKILTALADESSYPPTLSSTHKSHPDGFTPLRTVSSNGNLTCR